MKKLLAGVLAACLITASGWSVREETAIADKRQNKGLIAAHDIGTGQLIPLNIKVNDTGDLIVDGDTNTFTVTGVSLDAIEVAVEAIEGIGNTILATNLLILDEATTIKTNTGVIAGDTTSIDDKIDNGGGVEAGAVLVTMASDSTGLLSVDDNGGALSVDDNGSSISVDDNAGKLTIDWNGTDPPIGAGTEATALKVTMATDSTGLLSVDDNGGSLTVDGSVAITSGVTIASPVGGGTEAAAVRVTVANDSTGVLSVDDNGSTLSVDDGAGALTTDWAGVAPPIGAGTEATALKVTLATDSTGLLSVDDNGGSLTVDGTVAVSALPSVVVVDANNTSSSTLGIGATFTGTATDLIANGNPHVIVSVLADEASAASGLVMQFSQDGTNWPSGSYSHAFTLAADTARTFQFGPEAQYFRVVLTNGGTAQATLRLTTLLKRNIGHTTMHRVGDSIDADRSVIGIQKSIIVAEKPDTSFVNINATAGGNLMVAIEEFEASLLGGGVEAGALLVTMASDSTGVLSVDDNGGALTTDWAGTAPPIGAGTEATALKVTLATDSTGLLSVDDNGGSLTVDGTVTIADASANTIGARFVYNPNNQTKTGAFVAQQTDTAVWTPAAGKKAVLMGVYITSDTVLTIQLEDNDVDVVPPTFVAAKGGAVIPAGPAPIWIGDDDDTLDITSSGAGTFSVMLWGYEIE